MGKLTGTGTVSFDLAGDVPDTAVTAGKLGFWFGEETWGSDSFKLKSASLGVSGTVSSVSAVPLPAGGLLLLGALGGLAVVRRRKAAA